MVSFRLLLLVGVLSISIFSLNTFVMLPAAVVTSQPQLIQSAFGTFPGDNGKIAFLSDRDGGHYEIYVMNADGSEQTRLTSNSVFDSDADWSPDGTKIAFSSGRDGIGTEIYVMNADGSNPIRLTNDDVSNGRPEWSPDGTKIAFHSSRDGNHEIYVMNADGSNPIRLTNTPTTEEASPSWSPDGTKIAFQSSRVNTGGDVYVMNADGSEQTRLTDNPAWDEYPDWSPDGTKIAFTSSRDDGNPEIYVMNADGSEQTRLTTTRGHDVGASWSPDGTKMTFVSERDGNTEIYVMNADGSEQTRLTSNPAQENLPDWGPATDGEQPQPEPLTAEISASTTEGDAPLTVEFQAIVLGGTEPYSYSWDFGDGTTEEGIEPTALHTYNEPGTYTVTLTVTDVNGLEATDTLQVTVNEPPPEPLTAEIHSSTTQGDAPLTVDFEAVVSGGTPPYTYGWDFDGDGTTDEVTDEPTAQHTYNEPGTYVVSLLVIDSATGEDQTASDTLEITVNEPDPAEAIEELISDIQNLEGVSQSTKTSLSAPLGGALNILNDDNPNNDNAACGRLGAFINQVNAAERRGSLTEDQADDLRTQAEDIRGMLGC